MSSVLVISSEPSLSEQLSRLGEQEGFSVKCVLDAATALEWLKLHAFHLLCIPESLPVETQQSLGGQLWRKHMTASLVVYGQQTEAERGRSFARVFGADYSTEEDLCTQVSLLVAKAQTYAKIDRAHFPILVVEDLDSPRDIICFFLESLGFPIVRGVSSAKEAMVQLIEKGNYACVITDMRMPHVTGEELIREIRHTAALAQLPVIVLTAYGTADTLVSCLKAGASGFLVKPPKRDDLLREISRAMRLTAEGRPPRLASPDEAELIHAVLLEKGLA